MTVSTFPIQIDVSIPSPPEAHTAPQSVPRWRRAMMTLAVLSAALTAAGIRAISAAPGTVTGARSGILITAGVACFPLGVWQLLGLGWATPVAGLAFFALEILTRNPDDE